MTAYLISALATVITIIASYARGRIVGAKLERTATKAKEADAYEAHLQDLADAHRARNAVQPGSVPDDKYRRD